MCLTHIKNQPIRSYVRRERRLTPAQKKALNKLWPKYGIDYQPERLDLERVFLRRAPVVIDIGVGRGESTLHHAICHPENNYIAVDVFRPSIGRLIKHIERAHLGNIKIIQRDIIEVLQTQISDASVSQFFIFFPDPWPKKRHHKRRLVNQMLLDLVQMKLTRHGQVYIATDWEDYARHIQDIFSQQQHFYNLAGAHNNSPRPAWRYKTYYEARGMRLGHHVWEFCYGLA